MPEAQDSIGSAQNSAKKKKREKGREVCLEATLSAQSMGGSAVTWFHGGMAFQSTLLRCNKENALLLT